MRKFLRRCEAISFYKTQRLITLIARIVYFAILFLSFYAADIPTLPLLSKGGSAAFLAMVLIIPLGHASSFWFMTISNLSVIAAVYAAANLLISPYPIYQTWHNYTLNGFLPFFLCIVYLMFGTAKAKLILKTRYNITTDKPLPSGRLRIVHLADIHPHRFLSRREISHLYRMIDSEKPDLVALTGDIFDENTTPKMFDCYLELFSALHPRFGIFYVFGNHDTSSHWKTPAHNKSDIISKFPSSGIRILEDETETISDESIVIIGRKTKDDVRLNAAELMESVKDAHGYKILLCHEPVEFRECACAGADLILSGHTHGGQIFPLGVMSHRILKLHDGKMGKTDLGDGKFAVITSGVGTWSYPVRTEGKSEIVVIDILSNKST